MSDSLSRSASGKFSGLSRNTTLVRRNVNPQETQPSDVLVERFTAWKHAIKQLTAYFEGIAEAEHDNAKELAKLSAVIQLPFKPGNQFSEEGGIQDIYASIRDKTRVIADHNTSLAKNIEATIVQDLQRTHGDIKSHIKNIQSNAGKLATAVAKERELSTKIMAELGSSVTNMQQMPMNVTPKNDPYVVNQTVRKQMRKQIESENMLHNAILAAQAQSADFEGGIVRGINSAWSRYAQLHAQMVGAVQQVQTALAAQLGGLAPSAEWEAFKRRAEGHLDPKTPLRDPTKLSYPLQDDKVVQPVRVGVLERKKRYTRRYSESLYVLTPAGFLHEYDTTDPGLIEDKAPIFSLFLPACTLGPPSDATSKSFKFNVEGRKDSNGTLAGSLHIKRSTYAWTFKARTRADMEAWWEDMRACAARALEVEEGTDHTGPVVAAVRGAGYQSSESDEEMYVSADEAGALSDGHETTSTKPPSYTEKGERVVGADAKALKDHQAAEVAHQDGIAHHEEATRHDRSSSEAVGPDTTSEGGVSRKVSQRRAEKAPEGQEPHVQFQEPAHIERSESKFKEIL
ncbi:uncharacterized protein SCHCODRAFT_02104189 [Schizophyllum commune H4-8]|uniref:PH domain-containing protein n=1 Tax=Schizophyllum commune (strain H4-8 / FGSC 9210) TaxID=578458 RepID=D8QLT2_SCHCM|nr:uncharacterized protein SCHCODRAFT_02104189 [Schizophyllum commune H4-8]KAI5886674.1 hypothetical protein SCHCODRAFT_02104189 [Schizophyllum commune H4-8]